MSAYTERTESDYTVRLTERVRRWESKNAAQAAELRLAVRRRMGIPDNAESRVTLLALEQEFREEVRKLNEWPTQRAWMRGENG